MERQSSFGNGASSMCALLLLCRNVVRTYCLLNYAFLRLLQCVASSLLPLTLESACCLFSAHPVKLGQCHPPNFCKFVKLLWRPPHVCSICIRTFGWKLAKNTTSSSLPLQSCLQTCYLSLSFELHRQRFSYAYILQMLLVSLMWLKLIISHVLEAHYLSDVAMSLTQALGGHSELIAFFSPYLVQL